MEPTYKSQAEIQCMIDAFNRDHPEAKICYKFDYEHPGQHPIALFLGQDAGRVTVQGFKSKTVPVKLPHDMVIDYAGAIIIKGDLEGGKEIKSGKDIKVEGNVIGILERRTPLDFKTFKERDETPERLKIYAPKGSVYFQSRDKRKTNSITKVDVSAGKQIRGYNYDAEQVNLNAGERGTDESLISFTNNTKANRFTQVTASTSGGVVLPDCRDCRIIAEDVSLTASDDKTRNNTQAAGDFLPGKSLSISTRIEQSGWMARKMASAPYRG